MWVFLLRWYSEDMIDPCASIPKFTRYEQSHLNITKEVVEAAATFSEIELKDILFQYI
jgi:hypothetical protein